MGKKRVSTAVPARPPERSACTKSGCGGGGAGVVDADILESRGPPGDGGRMGRGGDLVS